jgi:NADH:ubiquinone oxidoreductase subunit F (NADH-binding)
VSTLPRLLLGKGELGTRHGPSPDLRRTAPAELIELAEASGLRGRGGASFPVGRKLRAVASRRGRKVVLGNGAEGEPASKKDRVLLREAPHLVLDGLQFAATAVGAKDAVVAVPEDDPRGGRALERALAERATDGIDRKAKVSLCPTPRRYLTGQETALVNYLNTGRAVPTFGRLPFERGIRQLPTLVQNVETLAHLALIARHGAGWFRELGPPDDPGSALITISGAVRAPGVYEIEQGMPLLEMLDLAGAEGRPGGVLLGGYFGSWIGPEQIPRLLLARAELAPYDAALGAGVIVALGEQSCGVAETARVADYLAGEGAGQCGPCVNGLGAIADTVQRLATGTAPAGAQRDLERWCRELPRRGACAHPDGAVRFVSSALRVFAEEFSDHARRGPCARCRAAAVLPTPAQPAYSAAA